MKKNTAGQTYRVFAFLRATLEPVLGDQANITAKLQLDGAAALATNDDNPDQVEDGYYDFNLTQAETNCDVLDILPESSTSGVQVIGVPGRVFPDNVAADAAAARAAAESVDTKLTTLRVAKLDRDLAHAADANLYKADVSQIPDLGSDILIIKNLVTTIHDVKLTTARVAKLDRDLSTFNATAEFVKLAAVDGVDDSVLREMLLAYISGLIVVTDNDNGTRTVAFKKRDGSTSYSVTYNRTTGVRTASTIGP